MNDQYLNIKFVQEVEKHPCLYNYKLPDYSRKDMTEKAWSAVGKTFNLTESQSKEKWKNLRAVFVRHMKPAPSGSSTKNKKPYYLSEAMQFTIPYIKALNNAVSGNMPQPQEEVTVQEDIEESNELQSQQNIPSPMSCPLPASSPSDNQPVSPLSCPAPHTAIHSKRRRNKRNIEYSPVDDGILDYFQTRKSKLQNEDPNDPNRMFLLSLLADMKEMTDKQRRTFKRKVLSLLEEILEESSQVPPTNTYNIENEFNSTEDVSNAHKALLEYYESAPFIINTRKTIPNKEED